MKKIFAITASLMLIAGLGACLAVGLAAHSETDSSSDLSEISSIADTQSSADDTQSDTEDSTPDSTGDDSSDGDSSSGDSEGTDSGHSYTDLPDDYDHSFDYTLLDEDGKQIFIPESDVDSEIIDRVYSLLFAAADGDADKYFEILDIEEYSAAILGGDKNSLDSDLLRDQCEVEKKNQQNNFDELSFYLGGSLTGRMRQIHLEKSDYLSTPKCDVYYMSFIIPAKDNDLIVDGTIYYNGDAMSAELELWSVVDHTYYDFEELITKQLIAAASGDPDAYKECACPDLYATMIAVLLSDGESVTDDIIEQIKEELEEDFYSISYEELGELLGKDFDGRVIHVQEFWEYNDGDYQAGDIKIYGRMVLTVRDSDGEYREVEGYCYTDGTQKGVWLQPD